ncbi:MAG: bifunctional diaminohydroxyphosphoribosylaminopyrimidine deaminase/5-amino-6-(5-phosphoribosylamino)uracil reductase RibD [Deltaproteobacteria bacterium]
MASGNRQKERDLRFLGRALELARRGLGRTSPNPPVGAVIVRAGRVVGEGYHRRAGAGHAEAIALAQAGDKARGATLYCTLEPCTVEGRTPACAPRVQAAGIARVVVGSVDPNPAVRGRGLRLLRRAGIEVEVGDESAASDQLIAYFRRHITTGLPFVRLKLATSLDGKIAAHGGASRWITGPEARRQGHRWRNEMDAVLVGIGTVLADDPALNCRIARGRDPLRIIVDSRLRTPPDARIFSAGRGAVLIATTRTASAVAAARLEAAGAEVLRVATRRGRVDLGSLLRHLGNRGLLSVLVEGGAAIAAEFLRGGHVDELACFQAPLIIGGDGKAMIDGFGISNPAAAVVLEDHQVELVGRDLLHRGRPSRPGRKKGHDNR